MPNSFPRKHICSLNPPGFPFTELSNLCLPTNRWWDFSSEKLTRLVYFFLFWIYLTELFIYSKQYLLIIYWSIFWSLLLIFSLCVFDRAKSIFLFILHLFSIRLTKTFSPQDYFIFTWIFLCSFQALLYDIKIFLEHIFWFNVLGMPT